MFFDNVTWRSIFPKDTFQNPFSNPMIAFPIPLGLTRDQFHNLVTDLYYELTKHGLDPGSNLTVEDMDEVGTDGVTHPHFAIFISETAAEILKRKSN
jgi:hypothetical protein